MDVYLNFESNGRKDKSILNKIKEIKESAEYTGGISSSGYRTVFIDMDHNELVDLIILNEELGDILQITYFPKWDSLSQKERLQLIEKWEKEDAYPYGKSNAKRKFKNLGHYLQNRAMHLDNMESF